MSSKNMSTAQRQRRNDKKRLQDFIRGLDRYLATGERIPLKKEPTAAMVVAADKYNVNAYDFFVGTISPVEQDRRRRQHNTYERERNERQAIQTNGKYNGTGERVISKTQEQEEYFKMNDEQQRAAHKKYQLIRDVQRGWTCPVCKNMVPDWSDMTQLEREDFVLMPTKSKSGDVTYPFVLHKDCHNIYQEDKAKKQATVHSVNTTALMLKRYLAWGKDGKKEDIVVKDTDDESIDTDEDKNVDKSG